MPKSKTPSNLVRLSEEEKRAVGYGTIGRFPASDVYQAATASKKPASPGDDAAS